jgi:hypothetical protein
MFLPCLPLFKPFSHCNLCCLNSVDSRYASGRTTGVVLDSGDGVTHSVPVYEGFAIPQAIRRIDIAGRDVTEYLQLLLRKAGATFHTSAEKEIVRTIKEKMCYVAEDPRKEEKEWGGVPGSGSASLLNKGQEYKLPDGRSIRVRTPSSVWIEGVNMVAWRGTISGNGDIVQSRDYRHRVSRCPRDAIRFNKPDRFGSTSKSLRHNHPIGWNNTLKGYKQTQCR